MSRNEVEWRCRRSILELDVIVSSFFKNHYDDLSHSEQDQFKQLILLEDPDLAKVLLYSASPTDLVIKIRSISQGFEGR